MEDMMRCGKTIVNSEVRWNIPRYKGGNLHRTAAVTPETPVAALLFSES